MGEDLSKKVTIVQGEFAVSSDENTIFSTILGSCVSVCLFEPKAKVGGMNHIVLPGGRSDSPRASLYGINAMELLINELLKAGANKSYLVAKVFGGAQMIEGLTNVGSKNGIFAKTFLENEGIECVTTCIGGTQGRRIQFWPAFGRARQQFVSQPEEEISFGARKPDKDLGALELF